MRGHSGDEQCHGARLVSSIWGRLLGGFVDDGDR
jgi:hypothetical protein